MLWVSCLPDRKGPPSCFITWRSWMSSHQSTRSSLQTRMACLNTASHSHTAGFKEQLRTSWHYHVLAASAAVSSVACHAPVRGGLDHCQQQFRHQGGEALEVGAQPVGMSSIVNQHQATHNKHQGNWGGSRGAWTTDRAEEEGSGRGHCLRIDLPCTSQVCSRCTHISTPSVAL